MTTTTTTTTTTITTTTLRTKSFSMFNAMFLQDIVPTSVNEKIEQKAITSIQTTATTSSTHATTESAKLSKYNSIENSLNITIKISNTTPAMPTKTIYAESGFSPNHNKPNFCHLFRQVHKNFFSNISARVLFDSISIMNSRDITALIFTEIVYLVHS